MTVQLLGPGGNLVATALSAATGIYNFSNVPSGNYSVRVRPADPAVDSSYLATAPAGALRTGVVLPNGGVLTGLNFGYQQGLDLQAGKSQRLGSGGAYSGSALSVVQGARGQFQLTLSNLRPIPADGSRLIDPLPSGFSAPTVISTGSTGGASGCSAGLSGTTLTLSAASLPVGGRRSAVVEATASTTGPYTNTTTSSPPTSIPDYAGGNDTAQVNTTIQAPPRLGLAKRVRNLGPPGSLDLNAAFGTTAGTRPGEVLEYCLDYANAAGGADALSVRPRDPVQGPSSGWLSGYGAGLGVQWTQGAGTTLLTSAADTDAADLSAGTFVLRLGTLGAGAGGTACFRVLVA